jgi:hypothetical protein
MAVQLIPLAVAAARAFGGAARFGAAGGRLGAAARGVAIARERYRIGTVFNTLANPVVPLGPIRMSLATTTTVYLTMDASFGTSTCQATAHMSARRVR